jgi:hypothetical protein
MTIDKNVTYSSKDDRMYAEFLERIAEMFDRLGQSANAHVVRHGAEACIRCANDADDGREGE